VRKSSQVVMGALSLVSVAVGIEIGATANPSVIFTPSPSATPTPKPTDPSVTPTPTSPNPKPTTPAPKPTTPTPKPTTPAPKPTTPPPTSVSHQGAAVKYKYGTVQVTVTKTGTSITNINMDQAGATSGRSKSFPYLVSLALSAQNSTFDTSMLSGATFSVNAFKQALDNALAQF
jgi:uncharacterized protein with FMN-binding domain